MWYFKNSLHLKNKEAEISKMNIKDFTYNLPTNLVPKQICEPRDAAKMIVYHRNSQEIEHRIFSDIVEYLSPGDCIVLNNTKVFPCVLRGVNCDTGAQLEIKLTSRKSRLLWDCSIESIRSLKPGTQFLFGKNEKLKATVIEKNSFGTGYLFQFDESEEFEDWTNRNGEFYLPLYLPQKLNHEQDYQTIYATQWGSMQPPVAGMHFTDKLLERIRKMGVNIVFVTLHVGRLDKMDVIHERISVAEHKMYEEWYCINDETAKILNETKANGKKVFAIGTTAMRTIESVAKKHNGKIIAETDWTDLYIYPGYSPFFSDAMISNLQPPLTTNLILACTFGKSVEGVLNMYKEAVKKEYGFLEFGDCALYI